MKNGFESEEEKFLDVGVDMVNWVGNVKRLMRSHVGVLDR